jgi:hypothetical protein
MDSFSVEGIFVFTFHIGNSSFTVAASLQDGGSKSESVLYQSILSSWYSFPGFQPGRILAVSRVLGQSLPVLSTMTFPWWTIAVTISIKRILLVTFSWAWCSCYTLTSMIVDIILAIFFSLGSSILHHYITWCSGSSSTKSCKDATFLLSVSLSLSEFIFSTLPPLPYLLVQMSFRMCIINISDILLFGHC